MAELIPADVEQYTKGRLSASDPETQRQLSAALKAVRMYCGWHVTPVVTTTDLVIDGPGSRLLSLPTLQLVELQAVTEDGTSLNVADLYSSTAGLVRKKSGRSWSGRYGSIVVTMQHGYTDAPDWQQAVLELVDRISELPGTVAGNSGPLVEKTVDDVSLKWGLTIGDPANQTLFSLINHALVDPYRLEPVA